MLSTESTYISYCKLMWEYNVNGYCILDIQPSHYDFKECMDKKLKENCLREVVETVQRFITVYYK